jgi:hypothetical protein
MSAIVKLVNGEVLLAFETRVQHAVYAADFLEVAVRDLGRFVPPRTAEHQQLAEHRAERCHLVDDHLDGLDAALGVLRQQLAGLLGQIKEDGPGLSYDDVVVDQHGDLLVRVQLREFRGGLLAAQEDPVAAKARQAAREGVDAVPSAACVSPGRGKSLKEIAREIQNSSGTARNYLKVVFTKTGANRQGELVSPLSRLR